MRKKIVWLVVSGLMVLSLLAAACAPKVEEAAPTAPTAPAVPAAPAAPTAPAAPVKEMVKLSLTKLDGTKIEKLVEKPRYGGTLNLFSQAPFRGFDVNYDTSPMGVPAGRLYQDQLSIGDWYRSLAGTEEVAFWASRYYPPTFIVGLLAESWEVPDSQTIIYHLRKGVKFQNKPPYGSWSGREMTADDVAFSIKQAYALTGSPYLSTPVENHPVSVEATGKYTVVVKSAPGTHILLTNETLSSVVAIVPRDFIEKYKDLKDWRNAMGTGPFFLVDYVPASVATLMRNPDYWGHDPLFPENQLPYVDRVDWFVIPDKSTQIAALRTGKVDATLSGGSPTLGYEEWQSLLKIRSDMLGVVMVQPNSYIISMQMADPRLPFQDVRVRRALSMAIDRESIIKDYFRGYAEIQGYPVIPFKEFISNGLYTPLEQQPALVQEIFSYNPAKAKQLLAEAGYPKGFKTSMDIQVGDVDYMTIIQEYFAVIGVDMGIKIRDPSVYRTIMAGRKMEGLVYTSSGASNPYLLSSMVGIGASNPGNIDDPNLNTLAIELGNLVYDEAARIKLFKEKVYSYILEQVYAVVAPAPNIFMVWQPWLHNYHGEWSVGIAQHFNYPRYLWLDQELKKTMGY